MKIFNTLTNKKEEFKPLREGEVSIYVCGPTVYNYVHIGNTRPMIVFDVLRRTYEDVRRNLNLLFPTYAPRVTNTMDAIIKFIDNLVKSGYAYEVDGDVYFRVSKIDEYGQLSGIKIEDLVAGASERIDENDKKEESTDFALWKKTDEGIRFDSPWSKGRPGWHTECVVMINDIFEGGKIDIHGGGQDLKFPHHENEIAQSMACHHHPIAHTWMHNQMINIDNQKMSKSLGNVIWAKDMVAELGCNVVKWFMLSSHYRNPLNLTEEVLNSVKKEVAKVDNVIKSVSLYLQVNHIANENYNKAAVDGMVGALEDDLNTSLALTKILDQVKKLNLAFRQKEKNDKAIAIEYQTLLKMTAVIGFVFEPRKLNAAELEIYQAWLEAKQNKDFETADKLRTQLIEKGII